MPCHHALAEALQAYIAAAGTGEDKKAFLFRTNSQGHGGTILADQPTASRNLRDITHVRRLADTASRSITGRTTRAPATSTGMAATMFGTSRCRERRKHRSAN